MKKSKKILAGVMAVCIMGSVTSIPEIITPAVSMTANAETVESGTCGENLMWVLDDDGTLTISGTGDMSGNYWHFERESVKKVIIEDGVTIIGSNAFKGFTALTEVTIPDSVTDIKGGAFEGCTGLTEVTIPNSVTNLESAFCRCTSLKEIVIPDSVTLLKESAFEGCISLTEITIPDSVTETERWVFKECTNLEKATLGKGMNGVSNGMFEGCSKLNSVTIPDSIKIIDIYAFHDCTSLKEVTIPNSVQKISQSGFNNTGFTSITIPESVTEISSDAFGVCKYLEEITILNPDCNISNFDPIIINGKDYNYHFNGTIYGYANSTAQAYAEEYGYKFVALDGEPNTSATLPESTMTGDANGDNEVNISDTVLIMQVLSNPDEYKLSESAMLSADVVDKGDGLTAMDALAIQMVEAKIITADDLPITSAELNSLIK